MKKPKSKSKLHDIRITLNAAATLLNTDRRTLGKRLHAIGVDATKGRTFTVPELFRAVVSEYSASRTRVSVAMAERIEAENRKRADLVLDCQEVEACIRETMLMLFGELERNFCLELPPMLVALDAPPIAAKCKGVIEKLKVTLRARFDELSKEKPAKG